MKLKDILEVIEDHRKIEVIADEYDEDGFYKTIHEGRKDDFDFSKINDLNSEVTNISANVSVIQIMVDSTI